MISSKFKGEVYRVMIRLTLYGAQCLSIKNSHVQKMHVVEIKILMWMCVILGVIGSVDIGETVVVASMEDKIRKVRLKWFGHVKK